MRTGPLGTALLVIALSIAPLARAVPRKPKRAKTPSISPVCDQKNLYLEPYFLGKPAPTSSNQCATKNLFSDIQALVDAGNKATSALDPAVPAIPEACFVASMMMRPHGPSYHYATCSSTDEPPSADRDPPCVTDTLADAVQQTLAQTMNCLGVDQKQVFSLFGWESHYQVNLYNSGGIGVGQLTTAAVNFIDYNYLFKEDDSKPECTQFQDYFKASKDHTLEVSGRLYTTTKSGQKIRSQVTNPCEWIARPDNLTRNLLYAGMTYRSDKRVAQKMISAYPFDAKDKDKIATELAFYMYNGGAGGVQAVFRLFMMRTKLPKPAHYQDFSKPFEDFLRQHFGDTNKTTGDSATKNRVADYVGHVYDHAARVEKTTKGLKCGD